MTSTTDTMRVVRCTAGLGLAALLAAGCAALDDDPAGDPELAGVESAVAANTYSRWDYAPDSAGTQQVRLLPNADGRLALFSRTAAGSVRFSQQVAVNSGWTSPVTLDGSSS